MNEKELVIKYLNVIKKLEDYYSKRGSKVDEYISIWKGLEKDREADQLRFIFNNDPDKMIKYINVVDFINESLVTLAISDKELSDVGKNKKGIFLKNYIELFAGYDKSDYLNDNELSNDSKELAQIYFDLKEIEGELYSWLKKTERKVKFQDLTKMGIFI